MKFYLKIFSVIVSILFLFAGPGLYAQELTEEEKWDFLKEVYKVEKFRFLNYKSVYVDHLLQRNLRIKVYGNPTKEDMNTLNNIITDIDSLMETREVKLVKNFPTLEVHFSRSIPSKSSQVSGPTSYIIPVSGPTYINGLFQLSITKWTIISNLEDQNQRNLFLRRELHKMIAPRGRSFKYTNSNFHYNSNNGSYELSDIDRFVIKKVYSKDFKQEAKQHGIHVRRDTPIVSLDWRYTPLDFYLGIIVFLLVVFFICNKLVKMFKLDLYLRRRIPSNWIRGNIIAILILQIPLFIYSILSLLSFMRVS